MENSIKKLIFQILPNNIKLTYLIFNHYFFVLILCIIILFLCFSLITLLPGDIILTGTPSGVGVFREPKEFLKV